MMAPIPERFGDQRMEPGPKTRLLPYLRGLVTRVWSTSSSTVSTFRISVGRSRERCSWISCCSSPSPVLDKDDNFERFLKGDKYCNSVEII